MTPILIQNLGPLRIYNRLILRPFTITMKIFMSINFSDKTFHTRFIILQIVFKIELYNYLRNIELLFDFYIEINSVGHIIIKKTARMAIYIYMYFINVRTQRNRVMFYTVQNNNVRLLNTPIIDIVPTIELQESKQK